MDNMTNIICIHNQEVTNSDNKTNGKTCNCAIVGIKTIAH